MAITLTLLLLSGGAALADRYPQVRIETTAGAFTVELDAERAPKTVENFLQYVEDGFYEGTIFHRVVPNFVIQGGGYTVDLQAKPTREPICNESGNGLQNRRLTIAMARTSDPHSADAQFYINLADNLDLDPKPTRWGYAVFGQVIDGSDVVDAIGFRPTSPQGPFQNLPAAPVIIERMVVLAPEGD
ncbi:MAG: peptidyl-prolyl cis-trans isomerase [Gammaproteobacteria bacterium]|nr:MAG: peptidyl-prolyl cis-trans isomerase [Gammaproteobacteria bacterium]